jgi:hypothetical protein
MVVTAHNVTATVKNRLKTPRLAIIEFILEGLPTTGSAGQLLHLSLAPNYTQNPQDLHYEQVAFDIKDAAAQDNHQVTVSERVGELKAM